jgi:protein-tyrosine phosphatase
MKKLSFIIACAIPSIVFCQLADSTQRLVHMQGAVNFRDAGGYKTADGKEVITGKVFRSADISKLTDADMQTLANKHIYTVIDFRGEKESAAAPDRQLPNTDYTLSPAGSNNLPDMAQMAVLIKQGGFLEKMYGPESVQYYGERYKPLFQKLLALPDTAALLYHCTGGRDRTGMASALLLYTLGVPQQKIEEDFTASNVYLQSMNDRMFKPMAQGLGMSLDEVKKQMELRPELIRSFFSAITAKYGSVENFMDKEIGIGKRETKILKAKYTK